LNVFLGPARKKKSKRKVEYTIDEELNEILQEKFPAILIIFIKAIDDNDHWRFRLCGGEDRLDNQVGELSLAKSRENSRVIRQSVLHRLSHGWEDASKLKSTRWNKFGHVIATTIPWRKKVAESKLLSIVVLFRDRMSDRRLSGARGAIKPTNRRAIRLLSPILYCSQHFLPSILLTN
jgi:hypothetical protein